jgi:hypothetical protein
MKKIIVDGVEREADVEPIGNWHVFYTLVAEMGDAGVQMYAEAVIEDLTQMLAFGQKLEDAVKRIGPCGQKVLAMEVARVGAQPDAGRRRNFGSIDRAVVEAVEEPIEIKSSRHERGLWTDELWAETRGRGMNLDGSPADECLVCGRFCRCHESEADRRAEEALRYLRTWDRVRRAMTGPTVAVDKATLQPVGERRAYGGPVKEYRLIAG